MKDRLSQPNNPTSAQIEYYTIGTRILRGSIEAERYNPLTKGASTSMHLLQAEREIIDFISEERTLDMPKYGLNGVDEAFLSNNLYPFNRGDISPIVVLAVLARNLNQSGIPGINKNISADFEAQLKTSQNNHILEIKVTPDVSVRYYGFRDTEFYWLYIKDKRPIHIIHLPASKTTENEDSNNSSVYIPETNKYISVMRGRIYTEKAYLAKATHETYYGECPEVIEIEGGPITRYIAVGDIYEIKKSDDGSYTGTVLGFNINDDNTEVTAILSLQGKSESIEKPLTTLLALKTISSPNRPHTSSKRGLSRHQLTQKDGEFVVPIN